MAWGDGSTWIKGKLAGSSTYTYVNLYSCDTISQENTTTYIISCAGHRFKIRDCVRVSDLADIRPPEEE